MIPVRAASAASTWSSVRSCAVGTCCARSTPPATRAWRRPSASPAARIRRAPWRSHGKNLQRVPRDRSRPVGGIPGALGGTERRHPVSHPGVEGVRLAGRLVRCVVGLDPEQLQLPLGRAGTMPPRRPRRRSIDGDHVRALIVDQRPEPLDRDAGPNGGDLTVAVHHDEVQSFRCSPPTSIPSARTVTAPAPACRCARNSSRSLRVRTPSTLPAFVTSTAGARSSSANAVSTGLVELDHRDRRGHDLGDVGLERVGVAEHALEQLPLADRSDELRSPRSTSSRTTGACEMPCSCSTSTACRTLSCAPHGDERRAARRPSRPAPPRRGSSSGRSRNPYCSIHESRVQLGQVLAARVGQQARRSSPRRRQLAGDRSAANTAVPAEPPTRMPSWRVTARAVRNASRSETRTHRSTTAGSNVSGQKSSPMPSVEVRPRLVARIDASPRGRRRRPRSSGFCSFRYRPTPVIVPPVPTPMTNTSIRPVGLLPDLRAGGLVVRLGVLLIEVLVGLERPGISSVEPVRDR